MKQKNKYKELCKITQIKNKRYIKRIQPWLYFNNMEEYNNYSFHAPEKVLLIAKTLGLPRFMIFIVFLFVKFIKKIYNLFYKLLRLIQYVLYFPAKIILPLIQIIGRAAYLLVFNKFTYSIRHYIRKFAGRSYHFICEVTAAIIVYIIGIPHVIWIASRLKIILKTVFSPVKKIIKINIAWLSLCFAGHSSIFYLITLFIKAGKIEITGDISHDVVKAYLGDYTPVKKKNKERFINNTEALFCENFENKVSLFIRNIDGSQKISYQEYNSFVKNKFYYDEIIAAYSKIKRYPNPLASVVMSYLISNLPAETKMPKNKNVAEINEEYKYFHRKKFTNLNCLNYILVIPVSIYDKERIAAGKLAARIMEAHLALMGSKLHVKIILPLKPQHDPLFRELIEDSLHKCYYPENVSWTIDEPYSDINFASVRGAQMLWAIEDIVNNKNINENTVVIISEMVGSVSYQNLPYLSNALKENCIVTGSRHMCGSKTLNKTIPDKLNSLIYNTYTRIIIPGNWSDSSAPLKLITKKNLRVLLPWLRFCSSGLLDFTFDEGLLAIANSMSMKIIQKPMFWADSKQKGGAERTRQGVLSQLYTTYILSKKIRLLRRLQTLNEGKFLFLDSGMDFNVEINKDLTIRKKPVRMLNALEIIISSSQRKTTDHTRFGIIGKLALKILPNYIAKRLGVIFEGRYRNPVVRYETLLPLTDKCQFIEGITKISSTQNGCYFEQKMLPILLLDILKLNIQYNNKEGSESVLDNILRLNKNLISSNLFDADFRSLRDTAVSIGNTWQLRLIDFGDLITQKNRALQVVENLVDALHFRRDFLEIKKTYLSNLVYARIFFEWYKNLKEIFTKENINENWKDVEQTFSLPVPVLQQKKDKCFFKNLALLANDGIGQMTDSDYFYGQIALTPLIDHDFNIPEMFPLPVQRNFDEAFLSRTTIIFLCNDKEIINSIITTMKNNLPKIKYKILSDNYLNNIKQLNFKRICFSLEQEGDIVVIPMDGKSSRMRAIMPKDIPHKAFLKISSYPILYWIIISILNFLYKKTLHDDLILYCHGDTLINFNTQIPNPALYIPKQIYKIGLALPKKQSNTGNQVRGWGKILQTQKGQGWEFPGLFILSRSMLSALVEKPLVTNFWVNVSQMTKNIKELEYRDVPVFFDFDSPVVFWRFHLLAFAGKQNEKKIICNNKINLNTNNVYISGDSNLEIINKGDEEVNIELSNIVITENSSIKIIIPDGINCSRISNAVFSASTGTFSCKFPSVTGVLAANFIGKEKGMNLLPLSCYGINGDIIPLFPDITNEEGNKNEKKR